MKTSDIPNKNRLVDVMRRNQINRRSFWVSAKGTEKDSDYDILIEFSPEAKLAYLNIRQSKFVFLRLGEKVDLARLADDKILKTKMNHESYLDNRPKR